VSDANVGVAFERDGGYGSMLKDQDTVGGRHGKIFEEKFLSALTLSEFRVIYAG
jgi:hypothetical protein